MKVIVYCHAGLIYRVSDSLYQRFIDAAQNDSNDPEELVKVNNEIAERYKPVKADYLATAADQEAGL